MKPITRKRSTPADKLGKLRQRIALRIGAAVAHTACEFGVSLKVASAELVTPRQPIGEESREVRRKDDPMTKRNHPEMPKPNVDKKTAEGKGEGGHSPHPETRPDKPAPFDPHAYRPNVEPPKVKPVGKNDPNAKSE